MIFLNKNLHFSIKFQFKQYTSETQKKIEEILFCERSLNIKK